MKKRGILMGLLLGLLALVVACGPGQKKSESGTANVGAFPLETSNKNKSVDGGALRVAMVKDSPIVGLFNELLYQDAYDGDILTMFLNNSILDVNGDFEVTDTGAASMTVDAANKKVTIKLRDGLKWSDGKPVTAEDMIYPYKLVGHKDYTGVRYNEDTEKIVGMKEYHEGKAEEISGIKKIDDKTIEITFTEMGQNIYTLGNGLNPYVMPVHHLGDVPIKDLQTSEKVRSNLVVIGPYNISKIVPGESIEFVANEHYFKGKPKIEKAILEIVNPQTILAALKAGKYDYVISMPGDLYPSFKDLDNIEVLGEKELYYSYMGFKVGKWDATKEENVMDPNSKMNDKNLRQALAYAINVDEMAKAFYHGLRERATSPVPPVFKKYYPEGLKGYPYDVEKAKKLLDDAGYKDTNGDGIREGKDGKPFEVKVAMMAGGDIAEPLSQFILQSWKEVGIKGVLSTGRLIEFNNFYEKVQADDPEIDAWFAAWGVGTNLSPQETAGRKAKFNFSRFTSEKNDQLIDEILGEKSLTEEGYKAKKYKEWIEYYVDEAVSVPLTYRYEVTPVNKRMKNVYVGVDGKALGKQIHTWEFTEKEPVKSTK